MQKAPRAPRAVGAAGRGSARVRSRPINSLFEVRLRPPAKLHPLAELFESEGASARLLACRVGERAPRRLTRWLEIEVEAARTEPLLRALRRRVRAPNLAVARLGPGRLLVRLREPAPGVCTATVDAGGICSACLLLTRGDRAPWKVVLPRGAETREFVRSLLPEGGTSVGVGRVEPYRSRHSLTRRQDLALRLAYELGYFAYPRRSNLADVARALGAGRSATLEVLRRATAKLAGRRYGDELRGRPALEVPRRGPRGGH